MVLIHEKISALLEQRRLKKRDLARALGVSPQTATDICKGRSAITLPHLRNLMAFLELRADYWLDEGRLTPEPGDTLGPAPRLGEVRPGDTVRTDGEPVRGRESNRLNRLLLEFARRNRTEFQTRHPDLTSDELRTLGFADVAPGDGVGAMGAARD